MFSRSRFALSLLFVLICSFVVFSQDLDDVTIAGRIADSNGLPIVGATVIATETGSGAERTVTTNNEGRYRFIELKPGTYKVKASANGFGAKERIDIATISGQNLQLDLTLNPADVQAEATVTVTEDDAPVVDITRTIVGGTITQRELEELPNVNRSPLDFVLTLGGVTEEPLSTRDAAEDRAFGTNTNNDPRSTPLESGIFSLSGGAAYSNNITIDGLDNNDDRLAQERFQPSIDAIAEVQVITNQFSAEYGRASGGRVNIRTRGGSKKFRGRAYLAYRNSNFNANTYNNNRRGLSRLPFTDYNPSFTYSGPIPLGYFKNKTFFFSSYEYDNFQDTTLIDTIVPVGSNPSVTLPSPNGGPERLEDTRNFPVPASFSPALVAPYVNVVGTPSIKNFFTQRLDHNFANAHNVTFNFEIGKNRSRRQFRTATNRLEEALLGPTRETTAYKFTDNYVFSSKVVNQFRFQYSIFEPSFASNNITDPVVLISLNDSLSIPANDRRNGTLTAGNSTFLANNFPDRRQEKRYQFQESLNIIAGEHTIKIGADLQAIRSKFSDLSDATGTFNFANVRAFLDNRVSQYRFNFGRNADQKNTYFGIFIQDEWRFRPNVTFSGGIRYESETILKDTNNFGPRLAVAFSPFKDSKGVIRIGAGIFYNRVLLRTFDDSTLTESRLNYNTSASTLSGPTSFNTDTCYVVGTADYDRPRCIVLRAIQFPVLPTLEQLRQIESTLPAGQTGFTNASNSLRVLDPTLKIPESYQFNAGFERDVGGAFVFEANYTYNKTIRLFREFNANAFILPTGFVDFNDYLVNGNTNPSIIFSNGDPNDITSGVVTSGGITRVNLANRNTSAAAGAPIGIARAQLLAQVGRRLNNGVADNIDQVASIGNSLYNGLIFELRRRFRQFGGDFSGSFRLAYTLSKLIDDGLNNTTNPQSFSDFVSERSRSVQDRRHRLALSGSFQLPKYLGRLNISPIIRLGSSSPFNLGNGGVDRNLDDNSNDRPNFTGNVADIRHREPGDPYPQSLVDQLSFAPIGRAGNLPRNAGRGPILFIFDMNVSREIRFGKGRESRFRLRPSIEFDNILNARVFTFGSEFIDLTPNAVNQDFLIPTRTLRSRAIRMSMRFDF
ncbi:MAG: carboxypeptidase regulatory-like domain-containing protein [Pyrinomonadaceae bacterium]